MTDKKALRRAIREKKRAMSPDDILRRSEALGVQLRMTDAYRKARTVYGYLPYNQEVRLIPILEQAMAEGKRVAVPKILNGDMVFVCLDDLTAIQPGPGGILEPVADGPVAGDPAALVLMPGLVFDEAGNRIGYGGGYYDRFLAREPHHPTIALCYDFQVVPHLNTDPHDIPVQQILRA